jgi:hypothetical protein
LHEVQRDPQRGRNQRSDRERHAKALAPGQQRKFVGRHATQEANL